MARKTLPNKICIACRRSLGGLLFDDDREICRYCTDDLIKLNARNRTPPHVVILTKRLEKRLRFYQLTQSEFNAMYQAQQGLCAICERPPPDKSINQVGFYIDHDHRTGTVRGLLCQSCNVALGRVQDDTTWLRRALNYLENPPKRNVSRHNGHTA